MKTELLTQIHQYKNSNSFTCRLTASTSFYLSDCTLIVMYTSHSINKLCCSVILFSKQQPKQPEEFHTEQVQHPNRRKTLKMLTFVHCKASPSLHFPVTKMLSEMTIFRVPDDALLAFGYKP